MEFLLQRLHSNNEVHDSLLSLHYDKFGKDPLFYSLQTVPRVMKWEVLSE
jgi:hypothetical protein